MKILFDGEPQELIEFFYPAVDPNKNGDDAKNFWNTLLNGLVESYKVPLQEREPLQEFPRKDRIRGQIPPVSKYLLRDFA